MQSTELAEALRAGDTDLTVLDIRSAEAFADFNLPRAANVPLHHLGEAELDPGDRIVVYGFGTADGERARIVLEGLGLTQVRVLADGAVGWLREVMLPALPPDAGPEQRRRFEEVAELSRYFGGAPRAGAAEPDGSPADLDIDAILGQARRASCGW